jgi:hypothetical protein
MVLQLIPRSSRRSGFFVAVTGAIAEAIVASLTSASRRQNHVASPYALHAFRLLHESVHRIPHSTFVTIGQTPL